MKVLLDTHVLLWWLDDDPLVGRRARSVIADPENEVLVSVVSLWEISVKARVGKLKTCATDILARLPDERIELMNLEHAHLRVLDELPFHHRDPFDHLLFAQAIAEEAHFVTADAHAASYPLKVIGCT